ncbi:hypothetical protein M413DRAFT_428309 [Hebeloma cylindrosporum]|uniref:DUF6533 domain-containing protein n=1 Tax=Hebeloma cylindrosporum TaxID=76867 RepID=A0A0C3BUQ6_HEBCY|nr:hypothetical protein M413DRAFT_428309 [Hebeloma cylindrosporum h7]
MACTIFFWDYILTFGMEVELVWKSKWNFMKGLYLFQRYLPFTDPIWLFLYRLCDFFPVLLRSPFFIRSDGGYFDGGWVSEVILTLRTWVVWNRSQHLSIILPILFVLFCVSSLVIVVRFVHSSKLGAPPYPGFRECYVTFVNQDIVFIWVLLIVWDAALLTLMLVPALQAYQDGDNTSLIKAVYRDGVIYYLYLFGLLCINIIVVKTLPMKYQLLLSLYVVNFPASDKCSRNIGWRAWCIQSSQAAYFSTFALRQ